ncbi:MAG: MarR family transcriptional regulator [Spirochaetales bacterium]|jgi:DNA-binding MarR family transcriptional regulator|nr:MarR family transcriptional regulator [Exilispira sp.]NMC67917.1 MarR family transcriptional regulator [Spirochaetales bacterium]
MFDSNQLPFISAFFKISRKTFTMMFSELEKVKIHPGQPPILSLLLQEEKLTQTEIASKVCVKPSTIAVILKKMEKNRLIEKMIDENDRRVYYIVLTEEGKNVANKAKDILLKLEKEFTETLTDEEKKNLINYLSKIIIKLDEYKQKK